jgi:hypothetical protein
MATKWQRTTIRLPSGLSTDQKEQIADLAIERIVERTSQGKDENGKRFKGYSKAYINSLDFKSAGKDASEVNLQLSGDMLAAIKILEIKGNKAVIGFEEDSVENGKADGNIRGTYGTSKPDPKKARPFLGISEKELSKIVKYVQSNK